MSKPKVVFMGTPDFAVPALEMLASQDQIDLSLVVTQPDRPAGRGKRLVAPAVKDAALKLDLPLLQTDSLRHPEIKQRIIDEQPDLVVVAAFGMILGKWILELPRLGCVNLHASLLPKYRGASPISAAILAGEDVAGVTLMQMDRGLDTGPMLGTKSVEIDDDDTTESLTLKLAEVAAVLLESSLDDLLAGAIQPIHQPAGATETRQLSKDDGRIDWSKSAVEIERHIRAMWSWPRAWTVLSDDSRMQIHSARVAQDASLPPGSIAVDKVRAVIGTGERALELTRVQLPGGRPVDGHALVQKMAPMNGNRAL